jgi:ABC-type branched-subunit amino acid transport system ATPase component
LSKIRLSIEEKLYMGCLQRGKKKARARIDEKLKEIYKLLRTRLSKIGL